MFEAESQAAMLTVAMAGPKWWSFIGPMAIYCPMGIYKPNGHLWA